MTDATATVAFKREEELAAPVARFLRNRAFRLQSSEVPFFEHRMDVYGYSMKLDRTVAVELKLTKWGRAVEQALVYQLCSDLVYIAMPRSEVGRVDLHLLTSHGVGLIAVEHGRCLEVLCAALSPVLRSHYREEYLSMLREEG
jgi:hypothetical protein